MKKIITILLVSLMVLTLTGCNSKKEEETVKNEEPVVQEVVKEEEVKKEETVIVTPEVKEGVTVVEEATKEDTVDVTTLSYWVNFLNPDGSLISRKAYKYGETPVYPTSPEYFDEVAYYAFREWDKKLSPVHMTQTYKALYDVTGYVKNENQSSNEQNVNTSELLVQPTTLILGPGDPILKFNLDDHPTLTSDTTLGSLISIIPGEADISELDILKFSDDGVDFKDCYIAKDGEDWFEVYVCGETPDDDYIIGYLLKTDINTMPDGLNNYLATSNTKLGDLLFFYAMIG